MKERVSHLDAAVCYLKIKNKILMLRYTKKWGQVYAPPGGKFEHGESPIDCVMREFKEETGLSLIDPKLQGISYWKDTAEGIIYIFVASKYEGNLLETSEEGELEWIDEKDLASLNQFDQNKKFTSYLFKDEIFEGKFTIDDKCKVIEYKIRKM